MTYRKCKYCCRDIPEDKMATAAYGVSYICRLCTQLRNKYSITYEIYIEKLETQNYLCTICEKDLKTDFRPSIDHDHSCCLGWKSCGKCIRDIVCGRCNVALGTIKDSAESLERAVIYLESKIRLQVPEKLVNPVPEFMGSKLCIKCLSYVSLPGYAYRKKSKTPYSWCNRCVALSKYKLNNRIFLTLLEQQNNKCTICERHQNVLGKSMSVDHDHNCCPDAGSCGNCIRGLLCSDCNRLLGYVGDNVDTLKSMVKYLTTENNE